jgi:hypothetical protein
MRHWQRWTWLTVGYSVLISTALYAQQVQGSVAQLDSGWSLPNGAGPTQHIRLTRRVRASHLVPHATLASNPSGLWLAAMLTGVSPPTGLAGKATAATEPSTGYWVLINQDHSKWGRKWATHGADTTSSADGCGTSSISAPKPRRVELSLWVANAPMPTLLGSPTPRHEPGDFRRRTPTSATESRSTRISIPR